MKDNKGDALKTKVYLNFRKGDMTEPDMSFVGILWRNNAD